MRNRARFFLPLIAVLPMAISTGCGPHEQPTVKVLGPPKSPPAVPKVKAMPLDPALQSQARQELDSALKAGDPILRAHALETVKNVNLADSGGIILAALGDSSSLVRKAAALAAGELQVKSAADRLPPMLQTAQLPEHMAIIFAMHRLGNPEYSHELEKTAVDPDPHIRGDTAMILGLLGEKSAVGILYEMLQHDRDPTVRLQAAGALWKLGDERGLDDLVAATISAYPDDQMVALLALAAPHDTRMLGHVDSALTADYPEVGLVAARAAGMLGTDDGYGVALNGAKSVDARQRFLAAMAMGDIGRLDAQPVLQKLLTDGNSDVRLAAAGALLEIAARK